MQKCARCSSPPKRETSFCWFRSPSVPVKQGHSQGRSGVCRRHGELSEGSLDLMKTKTSSKFLRQQRGVRMAEGTQLRGSVPTSSGLHGAHRRRPRPARGPSEGSGWWHCNSGLRLLRPLGHFEPFFPTGKLSTAGLGGPRVAKICQA